MNGETLEDIEIFNNTQFSLCKLGCQSPSFHELLIPAFKRGQKLYEKVIQSNADSSQDSKCHSPIVSIVCLSRQSPSTVSLRLSLSPPSPSTSVLAAHFVEVFSPSQLLAHHWVYSQYADIVLNATQQVLEAGQLQISVSSFCETGTTGKIAKSDWVDIDKALKEKLRLEPKISRMIWKDDKAAALVELRPAKGVLPFCDYQLQYDKGDGTSKAFNFSIDKTGLLLISNLAFTSSYSMQLTSLPFHSNETFLVETPKCLDLVDDLSFCAPPPVKEIYWKIDEKNHELNVQWKYEIGNKKRGPESFINFDISVKHFESEDASVECQNVEKQRKIVAEVHRFIAFYLGNLNCQYEISIFAVDDRNRRSEPFTAVASKEEKQMSLLLRGQVTLLLFAILLTATGSIIVGYITFRHKRKGSVYDGIKKKTPKQLRNYLPTDCDNIRVTRMTQMSKTPSTIASSDYSNTTRSSIIAVPYTATAARQALTLPRCQRKCSLDDGQYETIENYETNGQATTVSNMSLQFICGIEHPAARHCLTKFKKVSSPHLKCSLSLVGFQSSHFTAIHVVNGLLYEPCRGGSLTAFLHDISILYRHSGHSSSSSGCTGSDTSM
ncbi:hypothetical protein WR25_14946 [Diploscapter pachys]|uniref:Uncharacterized protein n=1 Tax=Diploscapter pachys TaxID=2018661 RepID=A0A2A2LSR2_9BILA|nr:hypothetical protein WR25_14946 [Diploscapter pachys]